MAVDDAFDSRIEVIGERVESWSQLESELLACRVDDQGDGVLSADAVVDD